MYSVIAYSKIAIQKADEGPGSNIREQRLMGETVKPCFRPNSSNNCLIK